MNRGGSPDVQRGARQIIKDYLNGKLIYAYPPPGYDERTFQEFKVNPIKEAKYFDKNEKKSQKVFYLFFIISILVIFLF